MKAVIFDADGTILDSMPVWDNATSNYLISIGIKPESELDEKISTMSFASACEYIIGKYRVNKTVDEMITEIVNIVADKYRYEVPLKEGAYEFIHKLHSMGVRLCVVTASERAYITDCLKRLDILQCMEFVMTCSEEKLDKNNSTIYDRARQRLGTPLEETVVFEDALHAVQAAVKGGYTVYGVYDKTMEEFIPRIKKLAKKYIYSYNEIKTV